MKSRKDEAKAVRYSAADLAFNRIHPRSVSSGDEQRYRRTRVNADGVMENIPSFINSFTKGLEHNTDGFIIRPEDFEAFIRASDSGDIDVIARLPLYTKPVAPGAWNSTMANTAKNSIPTATDKKADTRGWESMGTGQTFELEGFDPQGLSLPPTPRLNSSEMAAEMVELYWMALTRDVPFTEFGTNALIAEAVAHMNKLDWIKDRQADLLEEYQKNRKRGYFDTPGNAFSPHTIFRGNITGDNRGFHISQFLYVGTDAQGKKNHSDAVDFDASSGYIQYGSTRIDQRVRIASPRKDYMTNWAQWMDVQNAADIRGLESYGDAGNADGYRFMWTPRDLATYVHYDALHQAYFNTCLILLDLKVPFDQGIPFRGADVVDKQIGFATFGGPHILNLVSEVATRALKAVRYQKYSIHRRARPEQIGGFIHKYKTDSSVSGLEPIETLLGKMDAASMLDRVKTYNATQNALADRSADAGASGDCWLLPMAFAEGSPMHPSYGSGHATVAGACVTILKAFFDSGFILPFAYKPDDNGKKLVVDTPNVGKYSVESELNKLAANIAFGRNWAGVHWYSDQLESLRLGEQVALGILEEQKLTYGENFSMSIPLFDGSVVRI